MPHLTFSKIGHFSTNPYHSYTNNSPCEYLLSNPDIFHTKFHPTNYAIERTIEGPKFIEIHEQGIENFKNSVV